MIPAEVAKAVTEFAAAHRRAKPVAAASPLQIAALVSQGARMIVSIDAALEGAGAILAADAVADGPAAVSSAIMAARRAAESADVLCDLRGYLGRAVLNLSQVRP